MGDNITDSNNYEKLKRSIEQQYERKLTILQNEITSLREHNNILKEKSDFGYDELVITLKKENLNLIHEYEQRISKQIEEIKNLREKIHIEKEKKSDFTYRKTQKQEINHLKNILQNEKHENNLLKNEVKGLKIREASLIIDKKTAINLLNQEMKNKIKEASMKLVLSQEENNLLKKKIEKLEEMIYNPEKLDKNESKYKILYLKEKKNYEEILELVEQKNKILEETLKSKNSLEGVAAKIDSLVIKKNISGKNEEKILVEKFLVGLELYRLGLIHDGAVKINNN